MLPAIPFIEPERIGEMMQRDHRCDAALAQSAQHGAIPLERIFIPRIGHWLDSAPFHRHAVRVLPGLCSAVEVLLPAPTPPITGQTRRAFCMTFLFPLPPLIVCIIAFHLMRGGCR